MIATRTVQPEPLYYICWYCRKQYDFLAGGSLTHCETCQQAGYGPTKEQDAERLKNGG